MNDKSKSIVGLVIFLALVIFPVLYNFAVGGAGPRPELELPEGESRCVEDKDFMTAHHMDLLLEWRDAVVRQGKKNYTSQAFGEIYEMSLTGTCMNCHTKRETFCTRCHDYADVDNDCWGCHVEPEGQ
ncbi:MAG: cytochrome C [Candidatus Latescibacteria bacterium]|nr:cytochrome C [Candidatus Latescibacterota bacterium]NIO55236.1 cytochrome C [Candidatus Latescibacterota bacterium]